MTVIVVSWLEAASEGDSTKHLVSANRVNKEMYVSIVWWNLSSVEALFWSWVESPLRSQPISGVHCKDQGGSKQRLLSPPTSTSIRARVVTVMPWSNIAPNEDRKKEQGHGQQLWLAELISQNVSGVSQGSWQILPDADGQHDNPFVVGRNKCAYKRWVERGKEVH